MIQSSRISTKVDICQDKILLSPADRPKSLIDRAANYNAYRNCFVKILPKNLRNEKNPHNQFKSSNLLSALHCKRKYKVEEYKTSRYIQR
jgi:hypothetical protein